VLDVRAPLSERLHHKSITVFAGINSSSLGAFPNRSRSPLSHDPHPLERRAQDLLEKLPAEKTLFGAIADPSSPQAATQGTQGS